MSAIEHIVVPKNELAIRSTNASSGRDVTSVTANSERGDRVGINASFENASENNNTQCISNVTDETRQNIPDEVSELSVPETHFGRQPHTPHNCFGQKHYSATKDIVGDIKTHKKTGKRNKLLVDQKSICNRKKSLIISDNKIVAEGLCDFF